MKNFRQFVKSKIAYLFVNTTRVLRRGPHSPHPGFLKIPGIFSQFLVMKSEPSTRLVTKMMIYYQSLTIASYFVCSTPLTIVLLTLFQELLKKRPMVMILSVFLTLSSYRFDNLWCYKVLQQEWQQS